jgi:hypothetical protein
MKLLLAVLAVLSLTGTASAFDEVSGAIHRSSFTTTADTLLVVPNTPRALVAVVVSSPTVGGILTVYNSSGTATNPIGIVSLATIQTARYDVRISSGLTYTTNMANGGVTIIYTPR